MCTSPCARSTTIRFATEPVIVRFPANVLAMASTSQPVWIVESRYECLEQHHGWHVARQVRQHRRHTGEDSRVLKIGALSDVEEVAGQPGVFRTAHDQE